MIVVDDVSSDGSPEMIKKEYPDVRLIRNPKNMGFARTSNRGAREAAGRIIVMMNNDMRVPVDFIEKITAPFYEERDENDLRLFAVGAKTVDWHDGSPNHLCMDAAWRRGGIGLVWSDPKERCRTVFPQGGSAAYDKELYLKMGGFDPIFYPTYWDDYDLSYRAVKSGWEVLYEPAAVADHLGQATLKRQTSLSRRQQIIERNRLWFNWLNLDDPVLLMRHFAAIPWICARDIIRGRGLNGLFGFLRAAKGSLKVIKKKISRRKKDPTCIIPDTKILQPENFGRKKYYEI